MRYNTLEEAKVPTNKRIELPVFEDSQLGISTGLALGGFLPVSIFPRIDFMMCCMNQLVNHLDKFDEMSCGQFKPKVIIRTMVGSKHPLNPGPQHCQDHTIALKHALTSLLIVKLDSADIVMREYGRALTREESTILVEMGDLYG